MRRLFWIAVVIAVALVAASAVAAAASPTSTSTSMTTAAVKSAGISLKYPSTWTAVKMTKRGIASLRKLVVQKNPKLAAVLSNVDVSKFKFYALDVADGASTHATVNVLLSGDAQGLSLADFRDQVGQAYKAAGGTALEVKTAKVSGRSAFRTDVDLPFKNADGTTTDESLGQLFIPRAGSSTVVSVSATHDATGEALINTVLASVHLK